MFTPVEFFIGTRYIHARRGNHFIGFISLTAIVATALGVTVLLTILSIMNGFESELRGRILGMAAHVEVAFAHPDDDWPATDATVAAHGAVAASAPYVSRDVLVAAHGVVRAVELRGVAVARESAVTTLGEHLVAGRLADLDAAPFRVVVGRELARGLGVGVGDWLTLVTPQPLVTPAGMVPRLKRFQVAAVFEFGLQEHDGGLLLTRLDDARRLFRLGATVDGLRLRLHDAAAAPRLKARLAAELGAGVTVRDWSDTHRNLFRALATEKLVMFAILALAIGIAAFNVVSILVVAVTEKRADIAMLGTLGLRRRDIMRVFLVQGGVTGALGVTLGLAGGVLLAQNVDVIVATLEQLFGFHVLSPDIYYISRVPSDLRSGDVLATALLAALTSFAAPLYPAWLAASLDDAAGLRHE